MTTDMRPWFRRLRWPRYEVVVPVDRDGCGGVYAYATVVWFRWRAERFTAAWTPP